MTATAAFNPPAVAAGCDRETLHAVLEAYVDRLAPGRNAELGPLSPAELAATPVIGLSIERATAERGGAPDATDDCDLPIWAGVVPLRLTAGEPIPDARLGRGIMLPDSVAGMVSALRHPPGLAS
jgi:hypothetical protein